ncbi:hypothetical protein THOM_0189 [Trachipleistophora hominis]|uniref:Uncharacterized protein n=1 Tax=Trachipleistophora hominis TaxID=72359 RepID=L7JZR5_TRAHO|nr:hypothetical protein THOM_0189 [Trachipleistophora hominis]
MAHLKHCWPTSNAWLQSQTLISTILNKWDFFLEETAKLMEMIDNMVDCDLDSDSEEGAKSPKTKFAFTPFRNDTPNDKRLPNNYLNTLQYRSVNSKKKDKASTALKYIDSVTGIENKASLHDFAETSTTKYTTNYSFNRNNGTKPINNSHISQPIPVVRKGSVPQNGSLVDDYHNSKMHQQNTIFNSTNDNSILFDNTLIASEQINSYATTEDDSERIYESMFFPESPYADQTIYSSPRSYIIRSSSTFSGQTCDLARPGSSLISTSPSVNDSSEAREDDFYNLTDEKLENEASNIRNMDIFGLSHDYIESNIRCSSIRTNFSPHNSSLPISIPRCNSNCVRENSPHNVINPSCVKMICEEVKVSGNAANPHQKIKKRAKSKINQEKKTVIITTHIGDLNTAIRKIAQNGIAPDNFSDNKGIICTRTCRDFLDFEMAANDVVLTITCADLSMINNTTKKNNFFCSMLKKLCSNTSEYNISWKIQKSKRNIKIEVFELENVFSYHIFINDVLLHVIKNDNKSIKHGIIFKTLNEKSINNLYIYLNKIFKCESNLFHHLTDYCERETAVIEVDIFNQITNEILLYVSKKPSIDFYLWKKEQLSDLVDQVITDLLNYLFPINRIEHWNESISVKRLCRILASSLTLKEGFLQEGNSRDNMHTTLLELLFDCRNFIIQKEKSVVNS